MPSPKAKPLTTRQKWHSYSLLRKILVVVALLFLVVIIGLVVLIISVNISYKHDLKSQQAKYATAEARCNAKPVVVVESHALEEVDATMYTPLNPQYESYRLAVSRPGDLFGSTFVVGYYCTAAQARAAFTQPGVLPGIRDDSVNYASVDERKETYLVAAKSIGAKFYQPTTELPGYSLDVTSLDSENHVTFNYLAAGASRPDKNMTYDITLTCTLSGNETNAILHDSPLHVPSGSNYYGGVINYAGDSSGETTDQIWDTALPGAECELTDSKAQLSKQQGLDLLKSLREVDYSAYRSLDFTK